MDRPETRKPLTLERIFSILRKKATPPGRFRGRVAVDFDERGLSLVEIKQTFKEDAQLETVE